MAAVKLTRRYAYLGVALTLAPVSIIAAAPPALADCTNAGYATVCAQGDVRGGGPTPPSGPAYPGYCADPWYCSDDWGIDVDLNPPYDPGLPGRPGNRPGGGGGGIGPRG
jgi:hypothetical protein